jgi:hypothetical protein
MAFYPVSLYCLPLNFPAFLPVLLPTLLTAPTDEITLSKAADTKPTQQSNGAKATETKLGDRKPSKQTMHWAAMDQHNEFAAHKTTPQQDHRLDSTGIIIEKCIDRRQEPWTSKVRANVHNRRIDFLPSMNATKDEVREWLYLILTCQKNSLIADRQPGLVCISLREWKGKGKKLRAMSAEDWNVLCPTKWWCIDGLEWHPTEKDRGAVGKHIYDIVMPLVVAEAKKTGDWAMCEKVLDDAETLVGSRKKVGLLKPFLWYIVID